MSLLAYLWCVAIANLGLGFYWGARHRANAIHSLKLPLPGTMDRQPASHESTVEAATSPEFSGREPRDERDESEPTVTAPSANDSEENVAQRAKRAWQDSPKRLGEELERIERHLPMLRGCTDLRTMQRVVDELSRVVRRELAAWNEAWEAFAQIHELPTPEQGLLEQAISQAESTLTNLNRLLSGENPSGAVVELEKELVKLRRIQAFPQGKTSA